MFIIISHISFSASKVILTSTIEEARQKAFELLKEDYDELMKDVNDEFKVTPLKQEDQENLLLDYIEAYTYSVSFNFLVTISNA